MPINTSMMEALQKEYGEEKGKNIYYAMEQKASQTKKKKAKK